MDRCLKTWFVIVNPTSGNGACKKKWPQIKRLLQHYEFDYEFAFTEYSKHSITLVQKAIKNNFKNIISIGGDGTLHHIVNGIFSQNMVSPSQIHVGVIPIGTGNDWVKTHNIPIDIESAIQIIKNGYVLKQDLGNMRFLNSNKPSVFFNNSAGIGFDGYVVSKVEKYKHIGALAYLYAALVSIFSFKNFNSKIGINSEEISGSTFMISVGICKYSGGGMQLTNKPDPFDGLFDVSIARDFKFFDIVKNIGNLFNGKIDVINKVKLLKVKYLNIEIQQENMQLIQADGELIGSGNIEIRMLPKVFSFFAIKP